MYAALDIAYWFLARNRIAEIEQDAELISNMKLQKLLYYAQGVYYAIMNKVLFSDSIFAWTHGPVVESVYHKFKQFGSNGIEVDAINLPDFPDETVRILEDVYDVFGQYSAWKLREMTHAEKPWMSTAEGGVINVELIRDYFLENYIDE